MLSPRLALTAAALLTLAPVASARPPYKAALADYFGPSLAPKLNDCRTCHLPPDGTEQDDSDRPHNVFGERLKAVMRERRKAGQKFDIVSCLEAVAGEDSDGDGVSNGKELLTGHYPGEADDKPTAAELAEVGKREAALRERNAPGRWRPFEPGRRPPVPTVRDPAWMRNPIDAFLAAGHAAHRVTPQPPASRAVLLRRVYLDLIGLPPTRTELHAFLADASPDAYEKVVEKLLASPQYGERWGRHWMDVWRYSDWAGYGAEVRDSQPHIWRWRDWIVESLNADKGYDRMVQEMLAGDEIAPADPATLRATGFLVRNWYKFSRNVWLDRTVEHTSKAFLGLTLNCARCHDHMYDPLAQKEYYQFRAIFEPLDIATDRVPGEPNPAKDGLVHVYDAKPTTPTYLFVRGNEKQPDPTPLPPAVPAALGGTFEVRPVTRPPAAVFPHKQEWVIRETTAASTAALEQARRERERARQRPADSAAELATARRVAADARSRLDDIRRELATKHTIPPAVRDAVAPSQAALAKADDALAKAETVAHFAPAEDRLAESNVHLAEAKHAALLAVLRVEKMEDADPTKTTPAWKQAAGEANVAQRQQAWRQAQVNQAQAALALDRLRSAPAKTPAALAAAQRQVEQTGKLLAQAKAALKQPPATTYTPRATFAYPATSTGRRLALARWITDARNPLTARVAVNHVWMRHFGKPLVPTVFDFGKNGQPPSHPALLDWLATDFMKHDWSMKHLHRRMVTSQAYRMESSPAAANLAVDPDNRWLWRMNPHRMEAEAVRDSVLYLAGSLDPTRSGPELDHHLGLTSKRRSLYYRHAPEKQMEFLDLFDAANVTECYRRSESVVPQQALALANSSLVLAQARILAKTLSTPAVDDATFVRIAFEQVLGRPPSAVESAECVKFLSAQTAVLGDPKKLTPFVGPPAAVAPALGPAARAREGLVQVLFNHNDFVTIR